MNLTDGQVFGIILAASFALGLAILQITEICLANRAKRRIIRQNIHRQGRALKRILRG